MQTESTEPSSWQILGGYLIVGLLFLLDLECRALDYEREVNLKRRNALVRRLGKWAGMTPKDVVQSEQ